MDTYRTYRCHCKDWDLFCPLDQGTKLESSPELQLQTAYATALQRIPYAIATISDGGLNIPSL